MAGYIVSEQAGQFVVMGGRAPLEVTPESKGKIISFQLQILARLLPEGHPQKMLLTQLGEKKLRDTDLTQFPADINVAVAEYLQPVKSLRTRIDTATAAISGTFPRHNGQEKMAAIAASSLLHTAANILKSREGVPIISIRDYVDAQCSFILGFDPAIKRSVELRLNGIPWQLCSNPIVDRDGIFAWGPGFADRVDYIRSQPNGHIIFIAYCPLEGCPQFEAEPAHRAFTIWQKVLETVEQNQLDAEAASSWRDGAQEIPQENRLPLFRYHCFLQVFRQFYPFAQNRLEVLQNRGRLAATEPLPAVGDAVRSALAIVSGNYRSCMGSHTGGETTYFEFAHLLSLPELPQRAEGEPVWRFSMTATNELLGNFEVERGRDNRFSDQFHLRVALITQQGADGHWHAMV